MRSWRASKLWLASSQIEWRPQQQPPSRGPQKQSAAVERPAAAVPAAQFGLGAGIWNFGLCASLAMPRVLCADPGAGPRTRDPQEAPPMPTLARLLLRTPDTAQAKPRGRAATAGPRPLRPCRLFLLRLRTIVFGLRRTRVLLRVVRSHELACLRAPRCRGPLVLAGHG